jgi:urate oxidase
MVYVAARKSTAMTMEAFAIELAEFVHGHNPQVSSVRVTIEEKMWVRMKAVAAGVVEKHPTAFLQRGPETQFAEVVFTPSEAAQVRSGVRGLVILKTAHSAFAGFRRDEFTTLPETQDRLLGTEAAIVWSYRELPREFAASRTRLMDALLTTFATHESLSVQQTLYAMAEAALAAEPAVSEIELTMPNRHNLPVDLARFGMDNPNTIFVPTDEPAGHIHARVVR